MILMAVAFIVCIAHTFIPQRFYKLETILGIIFGFVAITFCFEFVARPASDTVIPMALWVMAAHLWLKNGIYNWRLARRNRKNPLGK